ncbi:tetratricopeptide repeat protein [Methanobacterium oryzae]|uniref:tetratricopeptide repeat protein n=1 Tax=Methanobacterium oryzae TaxID=69540 RepID=UPI003D1C3A59
MVLLGSLHLIHTGNYEEAINCFGYAISIDEDYIDAWNDLGWPTASLKMMKMQNYALKRH